MFHRCLLISMSQTSSKDSHLSQDSYFKCTHKCLLFNWIILILSYTLIGYLIADIHIYKLLIYPICEGIYYTDRISDLYSYTVVLTRVRYFVLLNYSYKSWSIIKTRDRFGICWSWRFQNTPYMSNLTKFWLRYLRLKTHDTILLFSW